MELTFDRGNQSAPSVSTGIAVQLIAIDPYDFIAIKNSDCNNAVTKISALRSHATSHESRTDRRILITRQISTEHPIGRT